MIKTSWNEDVAPLTTFGIHANAAAVVGYETEGELRLLLSDPLLPRPLVHIGAGSNLLFVKDFPGTLIHCSNRTIEIINSPAGRDVRIRAAAGMVLDDLCRFCALQNLWGLENLSGIPGEVGAAPVQNVGAYGVEAADVIETVEAVDTHSGFNLVFDRSELEFGYRDSMFKHPDKKSRYMVTAVTFRLTHEYAPRLEYAHLRERLEAADRLITPFAVRQAVMSMRDKKLPRPSVVGSAGSFFKNPVISLALYEKIRCEYPDEDVPGFILDAESVKVSAAWLIDKCGWKGRTIGGAGVWEKQPLVIVNADGNATSADVLALENAIVESVRERFGVGLTPEVEHIG